MEKHEKDPGLDPELDLEKIAEDLSALRVESERRLGRALAVVHYAIRQRERERRIRGGT